MNKTHPEIVGVWGFLGVRLKNLIPLGREQDVIQNKGATQRPFAAFWVALATRPRGGAEAAPIKCNSIVEK